MQYNFVLIRTDKGKRYARKILNSIKWLNENKYPQHEFRTFCYTIAEFMDNASTVNGLLYNDGYELDPKTTIIHPRCANPRTEWTIRLRLMEETGYKVVNSVDCIELTSNKLACSLHLQDKVNHPRTWEYKRGMDVIKFGNNILFDINNKLNHPEFIIAKPLTSLEQGANVKKIKIDYVDSVEDGEEVQRDIEKVPGNKIVIQEYIPYIALHRVIVIGGKALPYTFIDKPEWHKKDDWKVSCCLNRTTMKICENPNNYLLDLAEDTQKEVGGVINFIDIFEYPDESLHFDDDPTQFTNAEINTACSLNIHERLAKQAGRKDWNIHSRIAKQLVKELLNG